MLCVYVLVCVGCSGDTSENTPGNWLLPPLYPHNEAGNLASFINCHPSGHCGARYACTPNLLVQVFVREGARVLIFAGTSTSKFPRGKSDQWAESG